MHSVLPQGPLRSGDTIYFGAMHNSSYYILVNDGGLKLSRAFVDDATGQLATSAVEKAVPFIIQSWGSGYRFQVTNQQSTYLSNNVTLLQLASSPGSFTLEQYVYSPLGEITSGIAYTLVTSSGAATVAVDAEADQAIPLIPLPSLFYTPAENQSLGDAIKYNFCTTAFPTKAWCGTTYTSKAWTDQYDAQVGNTYEYCVAGSFCTGNCKSNCEKECVFTGTEYVCADPPLATVVTPTVTIASITSQSWFIALIVILALVVIAVVVMVMFGSRRRHIHHHTDVSIIR